MALTGVRECAVSCWRGGEELDEERGRGRDLARGVKFAKGLTTSQAEAVLSFKQSSIEQRACWNVQLYREYQQRAVAAQADSKTRVSGTNSARSEPQQTRRRPPSSHHSFFSAARQQRRPPTAGKNAFGESATKQEQALSSPRVREPALPIKSVYIGPNGGFTSDTVEEDRAPVGRRLIAFREAPDGEDKVRRVGREESGRRDVPRVLVWVSEVGRRGEGTYEGGDEAEGSARGVDSWSARGEFSDREEEEGDCRFWLDRDGKERTGRTSEPEEDAREGDGGTERGEEHDERVDEPSVAC